MSAADRREKIIEGAAFAFAAHGFAATTQVIAQHAGISEALLYRHFKSKTAIYRAVLRRLMKQQDVELGSTRGARTTAVDHIRSIRDYLAGELDIRDGSEAAIGHRLMMASLAGDGLYAKLIYRRAIRLRRPSMLAVAKSGAEAGDIGSELFINPANAFFLVGHVGAMLSITSLSGKPHAPYAGDRDQILRDATLFCARGLGFPDAAIAQVLSEDSPPVAGGNS